MKTQLSCCKRLLLNSVNQLHLFPEFRISKPTMDKELVNAYLDVAIRLTKELKVKDDFFEYYVGNYTQGSKIKTIEELISFLENEKVNFSGNDSRFMMGFRSIASILNNNVEDISIGYIMEVLRMLQPFFMYYKYAQLLVPGCSFVEDKDFRA